MSYNLIDTYLIPFASGNLLGAIPFENSGSMFPDCSWLIAFINLHYHFRASILIGQLEKHRSQLMASEEDGMEVDSIKPAKKA